MKRRFISLMLFIVFGIQVGCADVNRNINELVESYAKGDGYGYKTANLMVLKKNIEKKEENVLVPDFTQFSNHEIKELLSSFGLDLNKIWEDKMSNITVNDLFYGNKLSESFISKLKEISGFISKAFQENINFNLEQGDIQNFIEFANNESWSLMVRSTGMEDTDDVSNAGGNETVANVKPNLPDILKAMGVVVSSYFSPKSFNQIAIELFSKGKNKEEIKNKLLAIPFTPILIQRMIGEAQDVQEDDIPTSCVVFTQEPLTGDNNITTISCAFGHGEGVVSGEIPCDTYYVLNGNTPLIFKKVVEKKDRFKPCEGGLDIVGNPESITNKQALLDATILKINNIARGIAETYNKSMDIELVCMPDGTIYVVQARPVIQVTKKQEPNYIENINTFNEENIIKCKTLLDGQSYIREINNINQIIITETADQALSSLNENTKVVCIEQEASLLSHPMVLLRSNGDPVLLLNKQAKSKLESFISQDNFNLIVDPQRGIILNLLENEEAETYNGYLNYPISLGASFIPTNSEVEFIENLESFDEHKTMKKIMKELIVAITEDGELIEKRLGAIVFNIQSEITKLQKKLEDTENEDDWDIEVAKKQLINLKTLCVNAQNIYRYFINTPNLNKTTQLLALRLLEALLFQKPSDFLIESISLQQLYSGVWNLSKKITKYVFPLMDKIEHLNECIKNPKAVYLISLGIDASFSRNYIDNWIIFINKIFHEGDLQSLEVLINNIKALNIFPMWFNTSFKDAYNQENSLNILREEYQSALPIIEKVNQLKESLNLWKVNILKWENPSEFDELLDKFISQVIGPSLSDKFIESIKENKENRMAIMVASMFMNELVNVFDQSIKTIKSSSLYNNDETKVKNFDSILQEYYYLLERWLPVLSEEELQTLMPKSEHSGDNRMQHKDWLKVLEKVLTKDSVESIELYPSPDFNVSGIALGSDAWFERHIPKTYEDVFTTIHQSLIIIVSRLLVSHLSEIKTDNAMFNQCSTMLQGFTAESGIAKTSLLSVEIADGHLIKSYNLPLRNHSVTFDLELIENNVSLSIKFIGQNEDNRWDNIAFECILFAISSKSKYEFLISENGATYKLELGSKVIDYDKLKDFINLCINASFEYNIDLFYKYEKGQLEVAQVKIMIKKLLGKQKNIQFILPLLLILVKEEQSYVEALSIARKFINNDDYRIQGPSLQLLKALIKKEQFPDEIMNIAKEFINNGNEFTALPILEALIENEQFYNEIMNIVKNSENKSFSFLLLRALIEKEQFYDEIMDIAKEYLKTNDPNDRSMAIGFLEEIVKKEKFYDEIMNIAKELIVGQDHDYGFQLLKALVEKEQFYEDAIDIVKKYINSRETIVSAGCLGLLKVLVKKGLAYNDAINAVREGFKYDFSCVLVASLELLKALVEKRQFYNDAINAAKKYIKSEDLHVLLASLKLFKALVEKKLAYDDAISAAKKGIKIEWFPVIIPSLELFKVLVEKKLAYGDAIRGSIIGIEYGEPFIINLVKKIIKTVKENINNELRSDNITEKRKIELENILNEIPEH